MAVEIKASSVLIGLTVVAVALIILCLSLGAAAYTQSEERLRIAEASIPPRMNRGELLAAVAGRGAVGIDPTTGERHAVLFDTDGTCPLALGNGDNRIVVNGRWAPGAVSGTIHASWYCDQVPGFYRDLVFRAEREPAGNDVLIEDGSRGMVLHVVDAAVASVERTNQKKQSTSPLSTLPPPLKVRGGGRSLTFVAGSD